MYLFHTATDRGHAAHDASVNTHTDWTGAETERTHIWCKVRVTLFISYRKMNDKSSNLISVVDVGVGQGSRHELIQHNAESVDI